MFIKNIESAKETFKSLVEESDIILLKDDVKDITQALEMQTPKRVKINNDLIPFCPICTCILKSGTLKPQFCWCCGQKLNWMD